MDILSDALIKEGIVRPEALEEIKKKSKGRSFVVEICDTMDVDDEKLARIFADKFRFKIADLSSIQPDALGDFSKEKAMKYMCLPFEKEGKRLKVAMVDPMDYNAVQDVSFMTGLAVVPHVASKGALMDAIKTCFDVSSGLGKVMDAVTSSGESAIEFIYDEEAEDTGQGKDITDMFISGEREELKVETALLAPAIKLVNVVIGEAVRLRSSDIHVEPGQKNVTIRLRIDGVLKTHSQFPKWMHAAVVSRIKIMSRLDISNRKTPQDGAIKLKVGGKPIDLRISTLPTNLGEKVVIRVLNAKESAITLEGMSLEKMELEKLRRVAGKPQGIILVTGPTGSGKTTTLHAVLEDLHDEGTNIITVEDPVEYELEGITQVQVNEKGGLTFANTLRSILRQDPDIVMVGEIRDLETAEIAFRASMTGHLVLSTLHTTGTAPTVTRLFDIGVEPYLVSTALQCVLAQRLVRAICRECSAKYVPDENALAVLPGIDRKAKFFKGKGCKACGGVGYKGRIPVLEIMEISPTLRNLIAGKAAASELKEQARKEGMLTLYEAALDKAYKGVTTIDEVLRVIAVDDPEQACPNCMRSYTGQECPFCGKTSDESCKGCQRMLEVDWGFCPHCGKAREGTTVPEITERPRVLIVDDELGILKMVELALKPLNLEVHTAQNGREALDKAHDVKPHLVVTDINMPVMNGFDLIKNLRSEVDTMFIPIVILSSRDAAEDKLLGFTYGTDDYITKPFDYTELQARVKRLLQKTYTI